jgi:hypothetical protein
MIEEWRMGMMGGGLLDLEDARSRMLGREEGVGVGEGVYREGMWVGVAGKRLRDANAELERMVEDDPTMMGEGR